MYDVVVPVITHNLKALSAIMAKAEAHCDAKKIKHDAILQFQLFPDMLPFLKQVQIATDYAKGCAARLSAQAVPSFPDDEKSFAELQARLAKTIAFLDSIDAEKFNGAESRDISIRISRDQERTMPGQTYFNSVALPNFYFHMVTAFNILRHNGLEIGKGDFLGRTL
jgi:uncharacterized protein